jgi:predicted small integral membrane protein
MYEFALLMAQTASVFFITAWLSTGVYENLFKPDLNSTFTAQVLDMERMREEYPEAYADVAHRRISNPNVQKFLFRLIVVWELCATAVLWIAVGAMVLSVLGYIAPAQAKGLSIFGALLFTSTWAGFLIVGNWFCYWFCHYEGQNTHFQMTLWGMATMILVSM